MPNSLGSGVVEAPINAPSTPSAPATTAPSTSGQGEGAPQNPETGSQVAGDPQGLAEDGQSQGGEGQTREQKLLIDRNEILGLRNDRRQLRSQLAEMQAILEKMRADGPIQQTKPQTAKTEQDFWADPNAALATLRDEVRKVREEISNDFRSIRSQDAQAAQLDRERSEAVKLIHSQAGWDKADDPAMVDIIEEYGLGTLPPMKGAQAALAIFRQEKGLSDKSQVRNRAASIVGAPGAAGAAKIWPKAEVERLLDIEMKKSPDKMNQDLIEEIKLAQAENRIR